MTSLIYAVSGAVAWHYIIKAVKHLARFDTFERSDFNLYELPKITPYAVKRGVSYYELAKDYAFLNREGQTEFVPRGFVFDGASVPSLFWVIVGEPFNAGVLPSALIHDWRYKNAREVENKAVRANLMRNADEEFYANLRKSGLRKVVASVLFAGVRVYNFSKRW